MLRLGENIIFHTYIVSSHRPIIQNPHKGFIYFSLKRRDYFEGIVDDKEN